VEAEMDKVLDGRKICSEADFHRELSTLLEMGSDYGCNIDAVWDRLSTDVERPLTLVWKHADDSRRRIGEDFNRIIAVLERLKRQDEEWNLQYRFDFRLE
jgi:ribonuclease inhibitor